MNCKKGATTENQVADAKYMGYVDDCVCIWLEKEKEKDFFYSN